MVSILAHRWTNEAGTSEVLSLRIPSTPIPLQSELNGTEDEVKAHLMKIDADATLADQGDLIFSLQLHLFSSFSMQRTVKTT